MKAILSVLTLLAVPAHAEGFALKDLSGLPADGTLVGGGAYIGRAEAERLTLVCFECAGAPKVDVLLGRQDDGTEGRVRSGETSFARLEELCQARDPGCMLQGLEVAPAVGWITQYAIGEQQGSTVVVLRDGDLLTIRVIAAEAEISRGIADTLLESLVPQIVGE